MGSLRVVPHDLVEEDGHGGAAHGQAEVAGVGLLHRVPHATPPPTVGSPLPGGKALSSLRILVRRSFWGCIGGAGGGQS